MVERILVGTEGSEVAQNAVSTALRLARATDAEIRAVHAVERPSSSAASSLGKQVAHQRSQVGERVLEQVTDEAAKVDVPATTAIQEQAPAELLLDEAERWGADLVAIGAQGESGLSRAIRGSVADQLIRGSPVPVLTVHQPPTADPLDPVERIAVPTDGSSAAASAAPIAVELAAEANARVDLVYAVPPELEGAGPPARGEMDLAEAHDELAREALGPLAARCREADVPHEHVVRHGAPHREIVAHADETDTDLVAMSTRGRGSLERVLLGSTTDKVLRTSNVPVVTVAPPGDEDL